MVPTEARLKKSTAHGPLGTTPTPLLEMSEKISLDAKERLCSDVSWQVCPGHPSAAAAAAALCSLFRIWDCWTGWVAGSDILPSLLFGLLGLILVYHLPSFACTMHKSLSSHKGHFE